MTTTKFIMMILLGYFLYYVVMIIMDLTKKEKLSDDKKNGEEFIVNDENSEPDVETENVQMEHVEQSREVVDADATIFDFQPEPEILEQKPVSPIAISTTKHDPFYNAEIAINQTSYAKGIYNDALAEIKIA